jgi:hypothetical protein
MLAAAILGGCYGLYLNNIMNKMKGIDIAIASTRKNFLI